MNVMNIHLFDHLFVMDTEEISMTDKHNVDRIVSLTRSMTNGVRDRRESRQKKSVMLREGLHQGSRDTDQLRKSLMQVALRAQNEEERFDRIDLVEDVNKSDMSTEMNEDVSADQSQSIVRG